MPTPYTINGDKVFRPDGEIHVATNRGWEKLYIKYKVKIDVERAKGLSIYRAFRASVDGWDLPVELDELLCDDERHVGVYLQYSGTYVDLDMVFRLPEYDRKPEIVGVLVATDYDDGRKFIAAKQHELLREL